MLVRPDKPERVLISGARAPVALAIGHSFAAAGFQVHFVDSVPSLMVRWSSFGATRLHRVRPPRTEFNCFREDIQALVRMLEPCLIVPTCEEIFYLSKAAEIDGFSDRLFAPSLDLLRRLHSKAEFAELASACGVEPPRTWRVTSTGELQSFAVRSRDLVFKPDYSRFGAETLVRPSSACIAKLEASAERPWVVQEFVEGQEVCVWSAARHGKLVALAGYQPKWHFGGASTYFLKNDDPGLTDICRTLIASTNMTGQLSLDLIRTADGKLRPIECNPRSVSGVQLFAGDERLAHVLTGREPRLITPHVDACHVGPAFWPAAAARAIRLGGLTELVADVRRSRDVLMHDGSARATAGAVLDFGRFAFHGLASSRSSAQQSTADIEWNGESF